MNATLSRFRPVIMLILFIWAIHLVNVVTGGWLYFLGIEPRQIRGLDGVLAAPFLHGSFNHLLSNTTGLAILGVLICSFKSATFWRVTAFVTVIAGLGTWALAREGLHLGASSLVFGYFGYLVMRGLVERTFISVVVAAVVAVTYGGLLYGVLPNQTGISWEGHLFGFLAGLLAARWRIHLNSEPASRRR
ncbi:MAG: rhomboid family intramembrane serine protease [Gammaproteobacteria bacterium]